MRLFVAIELSDEVRAALTGRQQTLRRVLRTSGDARWTRSDQMHLTLTFLGDVAEPRVAAVVATMSEPFDLEPFTMLFGGLGVFPPKGAPRVLWLGVSRGVGETQAVQRHVADRVRQLEIPLEARPFHPHLTLARWRTSKAADARQAMAADDGREWAAANVSAVTLFQSRLSSQGSTYTALTRATLTRCPSPSSPPI